MNSILVKVSHDSQLAKDITAPASITTPYAIQSVHRGHKTRSGRTVTVMASNQPPSTQLSTPTRQ